MKPHFLFATLLVITSYQLTFSQSATLITPNANNGILSQNTIVVNSDPGTISLPVSGTGTRLMWIPAKSAFRVGTVYGMEWDINNMGLWSFASGLNTIASSWTSTAMGFATKASNFHSTAIGYYTTASGFSSTALGYLTTASGGYSTAMGNSTIASNSSSTAMGVYNEDVPTALLMVGNGVGTNTRSNALTILNDGRTGINTTNPLATLHVQGSTFLSGNVRMVNGNVGIGTNSPIAPLHIEGSYLLTETNYHFFNWQYSNPTQISTLPNNTSYVSLLAGGDIVTRGTVASSQAVTSSDVRIKNIIGISDNQQDLETLRRLKITDYRYKDVANWGNQIFKKVIAQQVEEVYPQAVRKQTSTLPDIYCLAEKVAYDELKKELTVILSKGYGIKVGGKIDFIHAQKGRMQAEVISVSGHSFTVKDWLYPTDKIFVFGRQVDDFRVVDYEALSMLGISAIQQLAKEVEELKSQNAQLKMDFTARLDAIESLLSKSQTGGNNYEK
jgi:hypothetical protein